VTVTNNQDIKTFFSYDLGKWGKGKEQVVEFPIQSYSKSINIAVEAQIKLYSKKLATVSHSK
jgi:predicted KAP-like P-loop ATPase